MQPQLKHGSAEAESHTAVSLIEMSDDAHVLLDKVPLDEDLERFLAERRENYAHSHGNYLPSLSKAVQLLCASRESSRYLICYHTNQYDAILCHLICDAPACVAPFRLMLVFLSDGAPSDHLFRQSISLF